MPTGIAPLLGAAAEHNAAAPLLNPTSIANLFMWWDASKINQVDGTPVASWADSSGFGNAATQATTSQQPTYHSSPPAVSFDGVDDYLQFPAFSPAATSIFLALQSPAGVDCFVLGAGPVQNTNEQLRLNNQAQGGGIYKMSVFSEYRSQTDTYSPAAEVYGPAAPRVMAVQIGGGAITFFDGTTNLGSVASAVPIYDAVAALTKFGIFSNILMHEALFYTRVLSGADTLAVINYLKQKWGI